MAGITSWGADAAAPRSDETNTAGLGRARNRWLKAAFDWSLAVLLLIAAAPLMLAIAWKVRRDGGPALFVQTREGRDGNPIRVFKFRTMYQAACNPDARSSVQSSDPGVTPVGAVLRRSGLDELPQLFNVLNGTMSLIGPRPHVFAMQVNGQVYEDLVPDYRRRLAVRPGITGLAQVRGWCGPVEDITHAEARVANDCAYIDRWSLLLDMQVLLGTVVVVIRQLAARGGA